MVIILFDRKAQQNLYPLAQIKHIAYLRYGIFSVKERWEAISDLPVLVQDEILLQDLPESMPRDEYLLIDAALKDDAELRAKILSLQTGEALMNDDGLIAGRLYAGITSLDLTKPETFFETAVTMQPVTRLQFAWQVFMWNDEQLRKDFLLLFSCSTRQPLSETNKVIQPENIIVEEGAVIEHCIINAATGPVYIGKNATIMEGSMLRGPVAICENATVKMGAKIYGATTIGPHCTVGGEIKNSVLQAFTNKAHDGYLGDAAVGCWCNLGAGTSNSNVKNSASDIIIWHKASGKKINAGKKCGMVMGDYSRTAINTSINSGTVVGICCNIFGEGLTQKIIPDFSWGMDFGSTYSFENALKHISNWKKMKGEELSAAEISALKHIFETNQIEAKQNNSTRIATKHRT